MVLKHKRKLRVNGTAGTFFVREDKEHVARCIIAIRERNRQQAMGEVIAR